jgi:hypothetical protein
LNGEGTASTNGANNSIFIDSSTNNFNIQRNGNASQGTFSPYGSIWSNYFDGTGDYLANTTNNTALAMGSGDFTIEFWMNASNGTSAVILDTRISTSFGNNPGGINIYHEAGTIYFYGGANTAVLLCSSSVTYNTWNHVAIVRSGSSSGNDKMYINGSLANTYGAADITNYSLGYLNIGTFRFGGTPSAFYNGYISNFRIVKGTAVYTSAFTPPTSPLTAIANTSLLTCQSNRFIDNSTNNFTITRNGDASIQAFNPFLQSATRYTPSLYGGSAYFDGTGDYLTSVANSSFAFLKDAFTVEMWIYPTATITTPANIGLFYVEETSGLVVGLSSGYLALGRRTLGYDLTSSYIPPLNTWTHVAVTRSGATAWIFANGVQVGTVTASGGDANNNANYVCTTGLPTLAGNYAGGAGFGYFPGYISNLRVVKGTAVYTTEFTPPTTPLTAIANTSLLTNFTNAGIIDQTGKNNLETLGGAQLSTAVKKYNNASIYFDGTGDYLYSPPNLNYAMGSGNFTIEFWYYPVTHTNTDPTIMGNYNATWTSNKWAFHAPHASYASKYSFWVNNYAAGSAILVSTSNITNGAWAHIAITRSGSTWRIFVNGTIEATTTSSVALDGGTAASMDGFYIGANFYSGHGGRHINAYIDDLRITKGYARYTANVTPPTAIT